MAKIIKLTEWKEEGEISVAVDKIKTMQWETLLSVGSYTRIDFIDGSCLRVEETPNKINEVIDKLERGATSK